MIMIVVEVESMTDAVLSKVQATSLQRVRTELMEIGYSGELMESQYRFGDWFSPDTPERTVQAAAFGRTPVGFDSACFAVVTSNGKPGIDQIRECRALGAPRAFEIDPRGRVYHWRVGVSPVESDRQQSIPPDKIDAAFREHAAAWAPESMLRAKRVGPVGSRQLDFIDIGLIPAIEEHVRAKLDPMLRGVLHAAKQAAAERVQKAPSWPALCQLVFRALTGKILHDRGIPGFSSKGKAPEADDFLKRVATHYNEPEPAAVRSQHVRQLVLDQLWAGVNLRHISVETLAYVWENTLLTDEDRRSKGIHATPPSIARYIVGRLPITEDVAQRGEVVEPCCGAATFLVAAMQRFRELLPRSMEDGSVTSCSRTICTGSMTNRSALKSRSAA